MTPTPGPPGRLKTPWFAALMVGQALWLAWFLLEPLPGIAGTRLRRADLLLAADDHLGAALRHLGHVENLPERLPILGASLLVAAACLAIGSLILRGLRCHAGLTRAERAALGFGLGSAVVGAATLLLGRWLGLSPPVVRLALGGLVAVGLGGAAWGRWRGGPGRTSVPTGSRWSAGQVLGMAAVAGPFVVLMGLGAMLPTVEFDALEYHLQGPKEYFLDGRIGFLPHNVYASMPFGVEMLTTLAMEVLGDWWLGGLAGQELIAWFAPATAVLIGAAASRIAGSSRAGWFAAVIYLTTPWVFRAANTPFVEGPLCFFHAALVWAVVVLSGRREESTRIRPGPVRAGTLLGLLAGGALAIKYPALVSAVIPAVGVAFAGTRRSRSPRLAAGFGVGFGVIAAPWLGKNWADTANPVYPLAWSVFHNAWWDRVREAQWQAAHGPRPVSLELFARSVIDVAGRSDWQSPFYAALAPLAWVGPETRRAATGLATYAAYLFLTWWLLTHRLDRFWLPMLPPLAILAGLGADACWARSRRAAAWAAGLLAVGIGATGTLCATDLCGPTGWTDDLATVRAETARAGTPGLARLDAALPPGARPLMIGQAGTFGLLHRPLYSTVFNRDRFESIASGQPPETVRLSLIHQGISHVYVDWAEVGRYRQPGNYGFTEFETPELFDDLVRAGVFAPPTPLGPAQVLYRVR